MGRKNTKLAIVDISVAMIVLVKAISAYKKNGKTRIIDTVTDKQKIAVAPDATDVDSEFIQNTWWNSLIVK